MNWARKKGVSIVVLVLGMALTLAISRYVSNQEVVNQEKDFSRINWEIVEAIRKRVQIYIEALHAGKALFDSSESVSRYDWNKFYNSLAVDLRYPGIQSYQFVRYVPHSQKAHFIKTVQEDKSLNGVGYPDFKIWPEGDREFYVVVDYIEPWKGNSRVFGLNTSFEERRAEAVSRSRDSGKVYSTSKITLVQETGDQAGIIIYLPVYKTTTDLSTAKERQENFVGFITGVFRVGNLMEGAIANSFLQKMNFEIFDDQLPAGNVNLSKWSMDHGLYSTFAIKGQSLEAGQNLQKITRLPIAGRDWMVVTTPKEEFFQDRPLYLDLLVFSVGTVISALLFLVVRFFEALGDSELRFRKLAEAAFEGVVMHDKGVILDANNAFVSMIGYPSEKLVGQSVFSFIDSSHVRRAKESILNKSNDPCRIEIITSKGDLLPIELRCKEIVYGGKEAGVITVHDLTEQEKAESQLKKAKNMAQEANKLKDKFLTLVSHDLRSPLGIIDGLLSSPPMMDIQDQEQKQIIKQISSISTGLVTMINKLLDISRLQTGAVQVKKTNQDLYLYLHYITSEVRYLADEKGVKFKIDVPRNINLLVDENLFGEVIQNIGSNAVKFCRAGDEISITYSESPNPVITIADTGVGIDPRIMENIFKSEVKTTTVGTAGEVGTGLGLPLSKDIVAAHGGVLSVESTLGAGSRFIIELPKTRQIVLVVDDQDVHRNIIKEVLKSCLEVEVLEADSAENAINSMSAVIPSLLITDVHMPGMSGIELIKIIKKNGALKSVPVIVISSSAASSESMDDVRNISLAVGADDFAAKPIQPEYFLPTVKKYLV